MDGWMDGWMDGGDGWMMDGWMKDGWMEDGWMEVKEELDVGSCSD